MSLGPRTPDPARGSRQEQDRSFRNRLMRKWRHRRIPGLLAEVRAHRPITRLVRPVPIRTVEDLVGRPRSLAAAAALAVAVVVLAGCTGGSDSGNAEGGGSASAT